MDKSTLLLLLLIAAAGGGYYTYKNSPEFRNKIDSLTNSFCKKACTGCGDNSGINPESCGEPLPCPPCPPTAPDIHPIPVPVAKATAVTREAMPTVISPVSKVGVMSEAAPKVGVPVPAPLPPKAPATAPRPA